MGAGETTGIVIITVAMIQGLLKLIEYLLGKQKALKGEFAETPSSRRLSVIESKITTECGLNERQSGQLNTIFDILIRTDPEGMPLVYFPRQSYGETQREIAEKLQTVSEVQLKMLGIIERLERRIDIDNSGGH